MKGLAEVRLPLRPGEFSHQEFMLMVRMSRSLHFGGCGVTEHVAPHLGALAIIVHVVQLHRMLSCCTRPVSTSMSGAGFSEPGR